MVDLDYTTGDSLKKNHWIKVWSGKDLIPVYSELNTEIESKYSEAF